MDTPYPRDRSGIRWKETSGHVWDAFWRTHHDELVVHSSMSDPEGGSLLGDGKPEMATCWGFKDSDHALFCQIHKKENREDKEWNSFYFVTMEIERCEDCRWEKTDAPDV